MYVQVDRRSSLALAAQKDAQTDLQRFQKLYQQNSISESDLRKAQLRLDSTTEAHNQAQAELGTAVAQRDYSSIRYCLGKVHERVRDTRLS